MHVTEHLKQREGKTLFSVEVVPPAMTMSPPSEVRGASIVTVVVWLMSIFPPNPPDVLIAPPALVKVGQKILVAKAPEATSPPFYPIDPLITPLLLVLIYYFVKF